MFHELAIVFCADWAFQRIRCKELCILKKHKSVSRTSLIEIPHCAPMQASMTPLSKLYMVKILIRCSPFNARLRNVTGCHCSLPDMSPHYFLGWQPTMRRLESYTTATRQWMGVRHCVASIRTATRTTVANHKFFFLNWHARAYHALKKEKGRRAPSTRGFT